VGDFNLCAGDGGSGLVDYGAYQVSVGRLGI
jgi:hypothetical protein